MTESVECLVAYCFVFEVKEVKEVREVKGRYLCFRGGRQEYRNTGIQDVTLAAAEAAEALRSKTIVFNFFNFINFFRSARRDACQSKNFQDYRLVFLSSRLLVFHILLLCSLGSLRSKFEENFFENYKILHRCYSLHSFDNFLNQFFYNFEAVGRPLVSRSVSVAGGVAPVSRVGSSRSRGCCARFPPRK